MKVTFETELLKSQRASQLIAPDTNFEVLQSREGHAIVFSIGSDGMLYVTREVRATKTGWTKVILSNPILQSLQQKWAGCTMSVKMFEVWQDMQTMDIDFAVVVTATIPNVGTQDQLWVSLSHPNTNETWEQNIAWRYVEMDVPGSTDANFLSLYLMRLPAVNGSAAGQICYVDVQDQTANAVLDRYSVNLTSGASPAWEPGWIPSDFDDSVDSFGSMLGNLPGDSGGVGMYSVKHSDAMYLVYITQGGKQTLSFSLPTMNPNQTNYATFMDVDGYTSFIWVDGQSWYILPPGVGADGNPVPLNFDTTMVAHLSSIKEGGPLQTVTSISVRTSNNTTSLWVTDQGPMLYYSQCPRGKEAVSEAWTPFSVLLPSINSYAMYLNKTTDGQVIFVDDGTSVLQKHAQDAATGLWTSRPLHLPVPDTVMEYFCHAVRIRVADSDGKPMADTQLEISAVTDVAVYIEDAYHILGPKASPVVATTDNTGAVTIVQEVESFEGVCYKVAPKPAGGSEIHVKPFLIDPLAKGLGLVSGVQTADQLMAIKVSNGQGDTAPLVDPNNDPTGQLRTDAAQSFVSLLKAKGKLPQDGSPEKSQSNMRLGFHNAEGGSGGWFRALLGDVLHFIQHAAEVVDSIIVDGMDLVVHIGDLVITAALTCVSAVGKAIHAVLAELKVVFGDIVSWLGFVFEWKDILQTHRVMKKSMSLFVQHVKDNITGFQTMIDTSIQALKNDIDKWDAPSDDGSAISSSTAQDGPGAEQFHTPQANWALQHTKHEMKNATVPSEAAWSLKMKRPKGTTVGDTEGIIHQLEQLATTAEGQVQGLINKVKKEIIDQFGSLSFVGLMKSVMTIVADAMLDLLEDGFDFFLELVNDLVGDVLSLLTTPIDIPVISYMYSHHITGTVASPGDALTVLDLVCLIASIPTTVFTKVVTKSAPFSESDADLLCSPSITDAVTFSKVLQNQATSRKAESELGDTLGTLKSPFTIMTGVGSAFGGLAVAVFNTVLPYWGGPIPDIVLGLNCAANIMYTSTGFLTILDQTSDSNQTGDDVANEFCTSAAVLKAVVDYCLIKRDPGAKETYSDFVSPYLSCLLGAMTMPVAIATTAENKSAKKSDYVSLGAGIASNLASLVAPGGSKPEDAEAFPIFLSAISAMDGISSVLYLAYAVTFATGN